MTDITAQDLTQDSIKESLTKIAEKALDNGAEYMRALADSLYTQVSTTEARVALYQQQLSNLDNLASHVVDEMKRISSSELDTAIVSRYNALISDLGKVEGLISSAKQASSMSDGLMALGKAIGPIVGSLDLLAALRSNESQNDVAKEAFIAGVGLVVGLVDLSIVGAVGSAVIAGALAKYLWDNAISSYLADQGADLSRPFWDALFDDIGLNSNTNDTLITKLQNLFHTAEVTRSPLILDLDGDGVETIGTSAGVHFDHDANGFAESTGWVGKDDGLLVMDRNGNGQIDDGSELFGNNTGVSSGEKAANGFAALADLDSNHDGKIDASDAAFSQLRVWKDIDSNGVVSEGELLTLEQANVLSISVGYSSQTVTDDQGNQHLQVGQYTRTDGSIKTIEDVWFSADTARTVDLNTVVVSSDIAALPDLQGFGSVHSLHQAMMLDSSGRLQSLVADFANESDPDARRAIMKSLLYAWAGVEDIDPASRAATQIYGNAIGDARKLATLEAFLGEAYIGTWCWGAQDPNPHGVAAPILISAFDTLLENYTSQLLLQTQLKDIYQSAVVVWNDNTQSFELDVSSTVAQLQAKFDLDPENGNLFMESFGKTLKDNGATEFLAALRKQGDPSAQGFLFYLSEIGGLHFSNGTDSDNILYGMEDKSNTLNGFGGDDNLYGADYDDVLNGGAGNDWIFGNNGDDQLTGGTGNDYLTGGLGNDSYIFNLGDGSDTILEISGQGTDTLYLGEGLNASATQVVREINDLVLTFNQFDSIRIVGYFNDGTIENVRFSDGTVWRMSNMMEKVTYTGTAGNDYLSGLAGYVNRIYGGAGNDNITGAEKDDILSGGTGNDSLSGGNGNDTYLFNLGDGQDVLLDYDSSGLANSDKLQFGEGITPGSTKINRVGSDLILSINETDKVTLQNYFASVSYRIEVISFADGTTWDFSSVMSQLIYTGTSGNDYLSGLAGYVNRIYGGAGNDNITGAEKDDILSGGTGNDSLSGGNGNDTYLFNLGDGQDVLLDYDSSGLANSDKLQFGAGITPGSTQMNRVGSDLVLSINETDKVTLQNYFSSASYRIETIAFADGTTWDLPSVMSQLIYTGTSGNDYLSGLAGYANRINGGVGNDNITGADGADYLIGAAGNDSLNGGIGNDILQGGADIDILVDTAGNNLLDGGAGGDSITGGSGNEFFIGGTGNDTINTGSGSDVIAFNQGDGQDIISVSTGKDNTLSLGGGIAYADLVFSKNGNDLLLGAGSSDQILFKDWYANTNNHSIATLQMIIEGSSDYDAASTNVMNNQKIEQFNFDGLVTQFDQARTANPNLTSWTLSSAMLNFRLGGSDTTAIGGDLAYQYAMSGNLAGLSLASAQSALSNAQFGLGSQSLTATSLSDLSPKLA
jgi:Ca2+-binding RTX toxin-like protein